MKIVNVKDLLDDRFRVLNELTALAGKFHERGDTQCSEEMMAILNSRRDFE
ncbi:hypothetical protein [Nocardia sp. NPDC019255]|uniref:hypothetical protein n=1 Tax=Nocardia sp. NPDC019255 TaxID=3154591 RepID=UPI0033D67BC0